MSVKNGTHIFVNGKILRDLSEVIRTVIWYSPADKEGAVIGFQSKLLSSFLESDLNGRKEVLIRIHLMNEFLSESKIFRTLPHPSVPRHEEVLKTGKVGDKFRVQMKKLVSYIHGLR